MPVARTAEQSNKKGMSYFNLKISHVLRKELETVRIIMYADSLTEVIRRALELFVLLVNSTRNREKIYIRDTEGKERQLIFLIPTNGKEDR